MTREQGVYDVYFVPYLGVSEFGIDKGFGTLTGPPLCWSHMSTLELVSNRAWPTRVACGARAPPLRFGIWLVRGRYMAAA